MRPSELSAEALPDAAIRAFQELHARLGTVFGSDGCAALFRRAVSRAAARHPVLRIAETEPTPERLIGALREHVRPANVGEVADAIRDVMAEHISVLTRFIGEELVQAILSSGQETHPDERAEGEASSDE